MDWKVNFEIMTFHPEKLLFKKITLTTVGVLMALCLLIGVKCFSQEKAVSSGKPVLLVFSGSDWCSPCVRFTKPLFSLLRTGSIYWFLTSPSEPNCPTASSAGTSRLRNDTTPGDCFLIWCCLIKIMMCWQRSLIKINLQVSLSTG